MTKPVIQRQYAGFLKQIAARDPLKPYTETERVADFKTAFGSDINWLEVRFLRYFDQMNSHLPAGRQPSKKKTRRAAGPTRPRPGGSGSRSY